MKVSLQPTFRGLFSNFPAASSWYSDRLRSGQRGANLHLSAANRRRRQQPDCDQEAEPRQGNALRKNKLEY